MFYNLRVGGGLGGGGLISIFYGTTVSLYQNKIPGNPSMQEKEPLMAVRVVQKNPSLRIQIIT